MRVHIDAGCREVTIECADLNVSPKDIATEALAVWRATDGAAKPSEGPAFGMVTAANPNATGFDWRMGEGKPTPVDAEGR